MPLNKVQNIINYCVITSTAALLFIAVNTILISQKSTRKADSFEMEFENLTRNLESLKNEIKNISIDVVPSKKISTLE